jgi:gluconate kinase
MESTRSVVQSVDVHKIVESHMSCIPQDLAQRMAFAMDACNYVAKERDATDHATIVTFSFVNPDLRKTFRNRFPKSKWLLIDTSDVEAGNRIQQRTGHFYKGKTSNDEKKLSEPERNDAGKNSDWAFAPVDFQHTIVDGMLPIESTARIVADIVKAAFH